MARVVRAAAAAFVGTAVAGSLAASIAVAASDVKRYAAPPRPAVTVAASARATAENATTTTVVLLMPPARSAPIMRGLQAVGISAVAIDLEPSRQTHGVTTALADALNGLPPHSLGGRLVLVAGSLQWLEALRFAGRNAGGVDSVVLLDPAVPGLAAPAASRPLRLITWEPLHLLEHALVGAGHHHLFSARDHRALAAMPVSVASAGLASAAGGDAPSRVHWRSVASPSPAAAVVTAAVASGPMEAGDADVDTLDASAVMLERAYRDQLTDSVARRGSLADALPSFGQSIAPTILRVAGPHTAAGDGSLPVRLARAAAAWMLGDEAASRAAARIAAIDQRVAELEEASHDAASLSGALGAALGGGADVRVLVSSPDGVALDGSVAGPESRSRYLSEERWDARLGRFAPPCAVEAELRNQVAAHAGASLALWRDACKAARDSHGGLASAEPSATAAATVERLPVAPAPGSDADTAADALVEWRRRQVEGRLTGRHGVREQGRAAGMVAAAEAGPQQHSSIPSQRANMLVASVAAPRSLTGRR